MIPILTFIRTKTSRRLYLQWRHKIHFGLNEQCDVIINHPIFLKKTYIFDGSNGKNHGFDKNSGMMRHLFLIHRMNHDGLLLKILSPGWIIYLLLFLTLSVFPLLKLWTTWFGNNLKQDWTPISLPSEKTYGFCRQDRTHPEGVRFTFNTKEPGLYDLIFSTGSGGSKAFLNVSLNGHNITPKLTLPYGWGNETSLRLPERTVEIGLNQLEFRVIRSSNETVGWAIRNVKILFKKTSKLYTDDHQIAIYKIRSALQSENIQGPELARYYQAIDEMQGTSTAISSAEEIRNLKGIIEDRMEAAVRDILVRYRAACIMGDERTSKQILLHSRLWIPENWRKGQEVLDGIDPNK